ncbi:MAG: hypothetical protein IJK52_00350 [Oscillospiraceae bacterium]|nr:hypothetical protein [Oscillospiraceae bacterium]
MEQRNESEKDELPKETLQEQSSDETGGNTRAEPSSDIEEACLAATPPPVNLTQNETAFQAEQEDESERDQLPEETPQEQSSDETGGSTRAEPSSGIEEARLAATPPSVNPTQSETAPQAEREDESDKSKTPEETKKMNVKSAESSECPVKTVALEETEAMTRNVSTEAAAKERTESQPPARDFQKPDELSRNANASVTSDAENIAAQNRIAFQDWMKAQGIDFSTAYAYRSALKQCGDFANSQGLLKQDIFTVSNPNAVKTLITRIRTNPTLAGRPPQESKKYLSALRKFMQFRTERPSVSATQNKETTLPMVPAQTLPQQKPVPASAEETERYQTVLREDFPDGFRQNYAIHTKKFIRRYAERYGAEPDMERDELVRRLRKIGYVLDGRIYAKGDGNQTELLKEINAAIHDAFQDGASCVFVSMLYRRYQQELGEQLRVYSADALLSLLSAHENSEYYERDGHLFNKSNPADFSRRMNDLPDVLRVMQDSYKPMNYQALQERLWYLPLENIKSALVRAADVVSVDTETYFYAPHFPISQAELETLSRAMGREIERRGFLTARNLRDLLERNCPAVSVDAASFKDYGLRNALGVLLRDRFTFNGAIVSEKGHELTLHEVWRDYCRNADRLTLAALKELAAEVNSTIYWDDVFREMVRISENEFVNRKRIRFSAPETDAALETFCPGDYVPIQDITLWAHFPPLEVPWNGYALESYLLQESVKFRLERVSASESGFYGVIVRNSSPFQNYEAVITDMLAHSREWTDEKTALKWIVDRGCQARKRSTNFGKILREAQLLREKLENETG